MGGPVAGPPISPQVLSRKFPPSLLFPDVCCPCLAVLESRRVLRGNLSRGRALASELPHGPREAGRSARRGRLRRRRRARGTILRREAEMGTPSYAAPRARLPRGRRQ